MNSWSFTQYTLNDLRRFAGWLPAIENAFDIIQKHVDKTKNTDFEITYIKEKYGGLRCEYGSFDDTISDILEGLEEATHSICEECGCKGEERDGGWIRTLCDFHYNKQATENT